MNTVEFILIPILAEVISFLCWREDETMNKPRDMCHFYTGARDIFLRLNFFTVDLGSQQQQEEEDEMKITIRAFSHSPSPHPCRAPPLITSPTKVYTLTLHHHPNSQFTLGFAFH